jgi:CelD/BcsL family acetyltransferase involved in cellulose biosynthesis
MGGGQGDALGPICRPEDRPAVAQGLTRLLRESDIALLIGEYLPRDEGWCDLVGASVVKREPSPTIALEGETWDTFLSSRTKRFRYQIRAKEKKLAADHRLDYRLADDPERFDDDLDLLFELHRARWPLGSSFSNAEAFQREFASVAFERGWCRLWFLEVDGEARAAYYGFRFADVDYAYQAGWDPDWSAYSLGFLLDAHVIREAVRNRVRELRLLRGGEGWKYRLATHDPGLETLGIPGSTAGSAVLQAARRLPRSVLRSIARTGAAITLPATVLIASVSFG